MYGFLQHRPLMSFTIPFLNLESLNLFALFIYLFIYFMLSSYV